MPWQDHAQRLAAARGTSKKTALTEGAGAEAPGDRGGRPRAPAARTTPTRNSGAPDRPAPRGFAAAVGASAASSAGVASRGDGRGPGAGNDRGAPATRLACRVVRGEGRADACGGRGQCSVGATVGRSICAVAGRRVGAGTGDQKCRGCGQAGLGGVVGLESARATCACARLGGLGVRARADSRATGVHVAPRREAPLGAKRLRRTSLCPRVPGRHAPPPVGTASPRDGRPPPTRPVPLGGIGGSLGVRFLAPRVLGAALESYPPPGAPLVSFDTPSLRGRAWLARRRRDFAPRPSPVHRAPPRIRARHPRERERDPCKAPRGVGGGRRARLPRVARLGRGGRAAGRARGHRTTLEGTVREHAEAISALVGSPAP